MAITKSDPAARAVTGIRIALAVGGILAVIVGLLVLVWPAKTAMVVTVLVAIYAIAGGLVYAGLGIGSKTKGGWARLGHVLLGIVYIVAGVIAFMNLGATTVALAFLLGLLVGVMWIIEGIVSLSTLADASSRGWTVVFALLSIVAGILMLFAPTWGIALLYSLLGISLVVLGVIQVIRALAFGKAKKRRSGITEDTTSVSIRN